MNTQIRGCKKLGLLEKKHTEMSDDHIIANYNATQKYIWVFISIPPFYG